MTEPQRHPTCEYCHRTNVMPCRNTREMEEGGRECYDALMRHGGGEYTVNREEAERRAMVFEEWRKSR